MEDQTFGLIGGILGACIGITGAAIGIYFSIKNTNGPKEKAFMVKFGLIASILFAVLLAITFLAPPSYKWLIWLLIIILLVFTIRYGNKKQQEIRAKENDV